MEIKQPRLLYLDVPFENEPGGDKNRSRFLFQTLREAFETDVVLMGKDGQSTRPAWTCYQPLALLSPTPPRFPSPSATPDFSAADRARFSQLLRDGQYDAVVGRFYTGSRLLSLVHEASPDTAVIMDVDMVSSRLVALSWAGHRSLSHRWFLFEKWKLLHYEKALFRNPWQFLFSNPEEMAEIRDHVAPRQTPGDFTLVPNTMPDVIRIPGPHRQPYILFFGSMDSAANNDGYAFLIDGVLPLLEETLREHNIMIRVVGKNPPAHFRERLERSGSDRVVLVGGVDSIEQAIAESLFVLLPLRVASGTRTRILEAAAQARAVITTPIGAEGLDVGDTVLIGVDAKELAAHTIALLEEPERADLLGGRLEDRCLSLYAANRVAGNMVNSLRRFLGGRPDNTAG